MIVLGIDPGKTFGAALWGDRGLLWSATLRIDDPGLTELERRVTEIGPRRVIPNPNAKVDAVAIEASFAPNPVEKALEALRKRQPASVVAGILKKGRAQSAAKTLLENRGILKGVLLRAIPNHFRWIEPMPSTWRKAIHGVGSKRGVKMAEVYDQPLAETYTGRPVSTHEAAAILLARFGHTEEKTSGK